MLPLLYNSDTTNIFSRKAPLDDATLCSFVDEVADSQVTTFLLCQGGQTVFYRSQVTEYWGEQFGPEDRATWSENSLRCTQNLESYLERGIEPFDLLIARMRQHGLSPWLTFRLNEAHVVPTHYPHSSRFWQAHPEYRLCSTPPETIGSAYTLDSVRARALNYALPQVRERRIAEITEAVQRFDFDGLELDFTRWPVYFKPDESERHIPTMTAFVRDLRQRLDAIAERRGRPLQVGVRVNSTLERGRQVGLDPVAWIADRPLAYVAPACFFKGRDFKIKGPAPLDINGYRDALPDTPIYAYIGCPPSAETVEAYADYYRHMAREAIAEGADGIGLFNFFTSRERQNPFEPPWHILQDLLPTKE